MSGKFNGALLEGHDKKIGLPCSKFATISGPVVVLMTWTLKVVALGCIFKIGSCKVGMMNSLR